MKLSEVVLMANTGADAIKKAPIVEENTGLKCLRIGDVSQKRMYNDWGFTRTSKEDYERYKLKRDDLIIARTGNTIGVNCFIEEDIESVYNNGLIRIQANTNKIMPRFLWYLVNSNSCQSFVQSIAYGTSTQPNMKIKDFLNFSFTYLNLDVQQKIINLINPIDEKIKINNAINQNLEEQANSIYNNMFVKNPSSDWEEGHLSDIADVTMGQSPSGSSYNESRDGVVFFQGRAEFGYRFPTIRLYTTQPKRMAHTNDVLMSVRAPVGDINVAYMDCCIGRGLAAIHSKNEQQSFLLYTMFNLKKQLNIFNSEGTVFGSINKDSLYNMIITIPSDDAIETFENIVKPIDDEIKNNYEEIEHLTQIRDILLPRLMSGEIDVSSLNI